MMLQLETQGEFFREIPEAVLLQADQVKATLPEVIRELG